MIEFFGAEGSGKTTTALDIVANAQKMGMNCFYVDAENTLDENWAIVNGVDVEELTLIKPTHGECAEEILDAVIDLVDSGMYGCGVIDSIPYLVPKAVLKGTMDDASYCGNSGKMTQFVQKVVAKLAGTNTLLIMINQIRDKVGSLYVSYNTVGGRMLKHAYSLRLFFNKGRFIDEECHELTNACENPAGNIVEVKVEKNKVSKPDRRLGSYTIKYSCGIDLYNDTVDVALILGILKQSGAWFYYLSEDGEVMKDSEGNEMKWQGKAKLLEKLGVDDGFFTLLHEKTCSMASAD
jgi:recombination protein RecA